MPSDEISLTLSPAEALTAAYGLSMLVSMLTGQLEDAGRAMVFLADEAGVVTLAEATALIMTAVQEQVAELESAEQ